MEVPTSTSTTCQAPILTASLREGRLLEYVTIGWNVIEGIVSVGAGLAAGSTALIGFGIDSAIESFSGAVLLWRLQEREEHTQRENRALQLVGVSFFLLATWVGYESAMALWFQEPPSVSYLGIAIAALSLLLMPWLAFRKRKLSVVLESRALQADSRQTSLCAYLSAILLLGLLLNALWGWWWADPVAALVMVPFMVKEGIGTFQGETCIACK